MLQVLWQRKGVVVGREKKTEKMELGETVGGEDSSLDISGSIAQY